MFEFNKYDVYGTEYVCIYAEGHYMVFITEDALEGCVFEGTYADCVQYVEDCLKSSLEDFYG